MDMYSIASLLGSLAFALSGFFVGVRKQLDLVGVFIVMMLTANGGGAVRDILVGRTPAVLIDPAAFLLVLGVMVTAVLIRVHRFEDLERRPMFVLSDSVGLVAFSLTGALVGIESGLSIFGVMVLAFITATGGGIIRDMIVNEVPTILSSDFYGSIALLMALGIYGLHTLEALNSWTTAGVFTLFLALRLLALKCHWRLPRATLD